MGPEAGQGGEGPGGKITMAMREQTRERVQDKVLEITEADSPREAEAKKRSIA